MHSRKTNPLTLSLAPSDGERVAGRSGEGQLPAFITIQPDGILLAIKLQPRALKNEIGASQGNELRVKVTAPPVDSAANEALLRLLAETLHCPRSKVELVRGHISRHKLVKVCGLKPAELLVRLESATERLRPVSFSQL